MSVREAIAAAQRVSFDEWWMRTFAVLIMDLHWTWADVMETPVFALLEILDAAQDVQRLRKADEGSRDGGGGLRTFG